MPKNISKKNEAKLLLFLQNHVRQHNSKIRSISKRTPPAK